MVGRTNRVVTGAHYGLTDWLVQRIAAILMIAYLLITAVILFVLSPQDHAAWKSIFSNQWMRIATLLFFIALFWHTWIGVRNILMDYVHPTAIRLTAQVLVIVSLLFYLIWSAEILWS